jgi:threonine dehydrogenase-like Zn-dependent dehydrogenase
MTSSSGSTSTGLYGSDLHLYEVLGPFLELGDIMGHEPMCVVEETGPRSQRGASRRPVVVPFNISCGTCSMCDQGLHSQCETSRVRDHGMGGSLFGYTKLYGQVPGGQAEYLRVPFANKLPIKVPGEPADDRFIFLPDVLPAAWQAVEYAAIPDGGTLVVLGLGPIGDMSSCAVGPAESSALTWRPSGCPGRVNAASKPSVWPNTAKTSSRSSATGRTAVVPIR